MNTVNETSKKRSPRFSVLDAVIILLVIVAVAGVYFRYNIIGYYVFIRDTHIFYPICTARRAS